MNIQQLLPNKAKLLGRGRTAIDPGPALASQINRSAQQQ